MAADIQWGPFGNVRLEDPIATGAAEAAPAEAFRPLPASLHCPSGKRRLHGRDDGVPFDTFWLSADGREAANSGGWIAGELTGEGGICHYRREHDRWRRQRCVSTWAI